jgi:FKBP-type peptidyl-prolyl cis-trans isomerase 2
MKDRIQKGKGFGLKKTDHAQLISASEQMTAGAHQNSVEVKTGRDKVEGRILTIGGSEVPVKVWR